MRDYKFNHIKNLCKKVYKKVDEKVETKKYQIHVDSDTGMYLVIVFNDNKYAAFSVRHLNKQNINDFAELIIKNIENNRG